MRQYRRLSGQFCQVLFHFLAVAYVQGDLAIDHGKLSIAPLDDVGLARIGAEQHLVTRGLLVGVAFFIRYRLLFDLFLSKLFFSFGALGGLNSDALLVDFRVSPL